MGLMPDLETQAAAAAAQYMSTKYYADREIAQGVDPYHAVQKGAWRYPTAMAWWMFIPPVWIGSSFLYLLIMRGGGLLALAVPFIETTFTICAVVLTIRWFRWKHTRGDEELIYRIPNWLIMLTYGAIAFMSVSIFAGAIILALVNAPIAKADPTGGSTYGTPAWKGCDPVYCGDMTGEEYENYLDHGTTTPTPDTAPYVPYTPPTTEYVAPTYNYHPQDGPTPPVESDRPTYESRYGLG